MESVISACLQVCNEHNMPIEIKEIVLNKVMGPSTCTTIGDTVCVEREYALYLRKLFNTSSSGSGYYALPLSTGEMFPVINMPTFGTMRSVMKDIKYIENKYNVSFRLHYFNILK